MYVRSSGVFYRRGSREALISEFRRMCASVIQSHPIMVDASFKEDIRRAAERDAKRALAEDLGFDLQDWPQDLLRFDLSGSLLKGDDKVRAEVVTREAGVFCGSEWALAVCRLVSERIECSFPCEDGEKVRAGDVIAELSGTAAELVAVERTLLNFLQLLSGIATKSRAYNDAVNHTGARVFDTRKTVPGLRVAQKYAVACGGCANHRMGLYDAYLVKENHLIALGGIENALRILAERSPSHTVQVEVESLQELDAALAAGAKLIMLDNFSLHETREAVKRTADRAELESSGDVTLENIAELAETGVQRISVGDLTKRVQPLDLSMRIVG